MNIKLTEGLKSTEAWANAAGITAIAKFDEVIGIPDNVAADAELMAVILVVKILAIAVMVSCYTMSRGNVKAAEKSPAPLILGPEKGEAS